MDEKEIALTIKQQIQYPNKMVMFSWGVNDWTILSKGTMGDNYCLGGLAFRVRGHHLKGWVCIHLMGEDTYTIRFLNIRRREIKKYEGIYCDRLQELIDGVVERIPEYKR